MDNDEKRKKAIAIGIELFKNLDEQTVTLNKMIKLAQDRKARNFELKKQMIARLPELGRIS